MKPDLTPQYVRRLAAAHMFCILGAIAFVISLALPAYYTYYGATYGMEALVAGPLGVLGGHFSWFANPLIWLSWKKCCPLERAGAVLFSVVAFALACTFLVSDKIPQGSAGYYDYTVGSGYITWLVSIALFIGAAAVLPSEIADDPPDTMPNKSLERTREG